MAHSSTTHTPHSASQPNFQIYPKRLTRLPVRFVQLLQHHPGPDAVRITQNPSIATNYFLLQHVSDIRLCSRFSRAFSVCFSVGSISRGCQHRSSQRRTRTTSASNGSYCHRARKLGSCLIPNQGGHGVDVWPFVGTDCPRWTANIAIWCGTVGAVGTTHPQLSCLLVFWMFLPRGCNNPGVPQAIMTRCLHVIHVIIDLGTHRWG